jgi:hypothetical protein
MTPLPRKALAPFLLRVVYAIDYKLVRSSTCGFLELLKARLYRVYTTQENRSILGLLFSGTAKIESVTEKALASIDRWTVKIYY